MHIVCTCVAIFEDPFKKPSYLFAVVAGKFNVLKGTYTTLASKRDIDLGIYIDKGTSTSMAEHALASLQKSMEWDERNYNLEYDLDAYKIVAVSDFVFGAME